jgi:hypothetical protein
MDGCKLPGARTTPSVETLALLWASAAASMSGHSRGQTNNLPVQCTPVQRTVVNASFSGRLATVPDSSESEPTCVAAVASLYRGR